VTNDLMDLQSIRWSNY